MKKIPKLKIDIRAQGDDDTATIDIDGEIGWVSHDGEEYTWNTPEAIKRKLREIQDLKAGRIVVNINSLGGFVNDGLAIHDVLAMHPAEIETRVVGMTASAATIIAQAGDVRTMSDNALYLIHRSWGMAMGNKNTMQEFVEELDVIDKRMLAIYTKRSGKSEDKILSLMEESNGGGKWIDAEEAKALGLIDETFEPMQAAACVSRSQFANMGFPEVPVDDVQFAEEGEKNSRTMKIDINAKNFFEEWEEKIKEILENQIAAGNTKENEDPKGESVEVGPEGISRFEAQLKVNSNHT